MKKVIQQKRPMFNNMRKERKKGIQTVKRKCEQEIKRKQCE